VAVGNTVHESPHIIFREHMTGNCNHKKVAFQSFSDSDSDSSDELAIGGFMHEVPVATAEGNVQPPFPLASEDGAINADDESVSETQVDD
jgi:hypothetical protein